MAAESVGRTIDGEFTVVVNKSTVPIGSGNWVESILRESFEQFHSRRAAGEFAVASNPEFLREGSAIHDTLYPGPDRDRLGQPAQPRRAQPALPGGAQPDVHGADVPAAAGGGRRGAAGLDRPRLGRADQVRGQRVPGPEDQLHQRDRPAGRQGRRRHHPGRPGHRPGRADRFAVPAARRRLGRFVLRQGHRGADRDRRRVQLRHADRVGRPRGQPAPARAGRRTSSSTSCASSRAARSACWAWRSSPTPTTCATRPRSTSPG